MNNAEASRTIAVLNDLVQGLRWCRPTSRLELDMSAPGDTPLTALAPAGSSPASLQRRCSTMRSFKRCWARWGGCCSHRGASGRRRPRCPRCRNFWLLRAQRQPCYTPDTGSRGAAAAVCCGHQQRPAEGGPARRMARAQGQPSRPLLLLLPAAAAAALLRLCSAAETGHGTGAAACRPAAGWLGAGPARRLAEPGLGAEQAPASFSGCTAGAHAAPSGLTASPRLRFL
jgi:hypothetical protein